MRSLRIRAAAAVSFVALAIAVAGPSAAHASATCTWAGTPAAPAGVFTITPGLTNLPSSQPSKFVATGMLAGADPRCRGRMRFVGQIDAGSNCSVASFEEGVQGLPGVARAWGKGSIDVPQMLYDRQGRVVGIENAEIATATNLQHVVDCSTARGFVGGWPGMFSSVVVLFDQR